MSKSVEMDYFAAATIDSCDLGRWEPPTTGLANAMVFSFNPTPHCPGVSPSTSTGASSGAALTSANLAALDAGLAGRGFGRTPPSPPAPPMQYASSSDLTVLSSFGPLNDGSTLAAGTVGRAGSSSRRPGSNEDGWGYLAEQNFNIQTDNYLPSVSWVLVQDRRQLYKRFVGF